MNEVSGYGKSKSTHSTFSSSGSDSSSTGEEERLRQLFLSCDSNQDGKLDADDLHLMCYKLNMADLAEEIIDTLGARVKGAITFDEFLRCRRKVFQGDMSAASSSAGTTGDDPVGFQHNNSNSMVNQVMGRQYVSQGMDHRDTRFRSVPKATQIDSSASDNSLVNSGAEYDSGAQDLSCEPQNLARLLRTHYPDLYTKFYQTDGSAANPSVGHLMEALNTLHLSTIASLRVELRDLSNRLQGSGNNAVQHQQQPSTTNGNTTTLQLHQLQHQHQKELHRLQKEKSRLKADLTQQSARYEDRLTELHSVIAELHKKVDRQDAGVIVEEDERDVLLESVQEEEEETNETPSTSGTKLPQLTKMTTSMTSPVGLGPLPDHYRRQIETLQSGQAFLQEKVSNYECLLDSMRHQISAMSEEKELLRRTLHDSSSPQHHPQSPQKHIPSSTPPHALSPSRHPQPPASLSACPSGTRRQSSPGVTRGNQYKSSSPLMPGAPMSPGCWLCSGKTNVDHWIQQLPTTPHGLLSSLADISGVSPGLCELLRCVSGEAERMSAQLERCRADRWLIQLSLEEAKSTGGRLQCQVHQLEANTGALLRANTAADTAIEIHEVLHQMADSELHLLQSTCRSAGFSPPLPDPPEPPTSHYANADVLFPPAHYYSYSAGSSANNAETEVMLNRARTSRRQAELAARNLVARLENHSGSMGGGGGRQTPDSGAASTVGSGGSSGGALTGGWRGEERRLRAHLDRVTAERSLLRYSIADIDGGASSQGARSSSQMSLPLSSPAVSVIDLPTDQQGPPGYDLENAVLLQELCIVKEEKADTKARLYLLEKEMRACELKLESKGANEQVFLIQIEHLKSELAELKKLQLGGSPQLPGDTQTEARLKAQIKDLLASLEQLRINSEVRQQQTEQFVNDLKQANGALVSAFEKAKRLFQSRIRKLEADVASVKSSKSSCDYPGYSQHAPHLSHFNVTSSSSSSSAAHLANETAL